MRILLAVALLALSACGGGDPGPSLTPAEECLVRLTKGWRGAIDSELIEFCERQYVAEAAR